ncbi:hypothetical protein [Caballeronia sp. dw_19]|uniref:hypothetical protein n=1 Tax=Caballeronia sp. dw_19 TaxID=2719791 RepID=UPI001BD1FF46|nr:hypothetical protein [Caballeronia sp. dw_19]
MHGLPHPRAQTPADDCATYRPARNNRSTDQGNPEDGPIADAGDGRLRLAELEPHFHCSVLGTCLSGPVLHGIVRYFSGPGWRGRSDFEVHHAAVQLAAEGGAAADILHEALDHRWSAMLARFGEVTDVCELYEIWGARQQDRDLPGTYWALMTHPCATVELRQRVFCEIHGMRLLPADPE